MLLPEGDAQPGVACTSVIKAMVLQYFHDSVLSDQMGAIKTFSRIAKTFYWPMMRAETFVYVRQCDLCQRAKPA
jgi:hypothetical protein